MSVSSERATINMFRNALRAKGYDCKEFELGDRRFTKFTAPNGGVWLTRDAHISYPMVSNACTQIAKDKHLTYELCGKADIRVPQTIATKELHHKRDEISVLLAQHKVVVKPNDASLSWGVTLNVKTREQLELAFKHAQEYSEIVLIQQQVYGEEVRFLVVDGKTKAALLRKTPSVIGDGQHTLHDLIDQENQHRRDMTDSLVPYPMIDQEIIEYGDLDMTSVPATGEVVELGASTMIRGGASVFNLIDTIDEGYKAIAEKAADELGSPFVAVDIMIKDIKQPCTDDNYAIIEFNSAPVLSLCYSCRDGNHYDAVADLVPLIERSLGVTHG